MIRVGLIVAIMTIFTFGCAATSAAQRVVIADAPCLPLLYTAAQCIWTNTKGALPTSPSAPSNP